MGDLPNIFPGYQVVTTLAQGRNSRRHGGKLPAKIGLTIPQMIDELIDGSMKGMFIVGEDTAVNDPRVRTSEVA